MATFKFEGKDSAKSRLTALLQYALEKRNEEKIAKNVLKADSEAVARFIVSCEKFTIKKKED